MRAPERNPGLLVEPADRLLERITGPPWCSLKMTKPRFAGDSYRQANLTARTCREQFNQRNNPLASKAIIHNSNCVGLLACSHAFCPQGHEVLALRDVLLGRDDLVIDLSLKNFATSCKAQCRLMRIVLTLQHC
ncbi:MULTISPECIES: hypothetical protein [Pseudomonas]|uniref:Uncharacterized protein n=1 Tax=Pseudomonas quercus TaxID=2722792 RepID=A0ABX0YCT1_9PSED|nr:MULTISPECIES: hypothetical protein [Pseudomonas]MBF7142592.1 hypothetical protein [Pseudomonas sp. LY10J]NJP01130.1 hypothetical protein [Pseudomonas quercus]